MLVEIAMMQDPETCVWEALKSVQSDSESEDEDEDEEDDDDDVEIEFDCGGGKGAGGIGARESKSNKKRTRSDEGVDDLQMVLVRMGHFDAMFRCLHDVFVT